MIWCWYDPHAFSVENLDDGGEVLSQVVKITMTIPQKRDFPVPIVSLFALMKTVS